MRADILFGPWPSRESVVFHQQILYGVSYEYVFGAPDPNQGSGASRTKGGEAPVWPGAGPEPGGQRGPHLAGTFLGPFAKSREKLLEGFLVGGEVNQ